MSDDMTRSVELDQAALDDLRGVVGDDPEFLAEMVDSFVTDARELLSAMRRAVEDGDPQELRRPAHTLKSHCRTFGALELAGLCEEIEQRADDESHERLSSLVSRAVDAYPAVERALKAVRPGS